MVEESQATAQLEERHEEGDVTEDAEAVIIIPTFTFLIIS